MRYKPIFKTRFIKFPFRNFLFPLWGLGGFLLLLQACNLGSSSNSDPKDPTPQERTLPPITTTGENTFGCKINGKVWIPEGPVPFGQANLSASYFNGVFELRALGNNDIYGNKGMGVGASDIFSEGISEETNIAYYFDFDTDCDYFSDDNTPAIGGELNILKFDLVNNIIAGTFQFTLVNEDCDTLRVTEGRFDVKPY